MPKQKINKEDNPYPEFVSESYPVLINSHLTPKRIEYRTLEGFIKLLKTQNKKLSNLGCRVTFTITLPIKSHVQLSKGQRPKKHN